MLSEYLDPVERELESFERLTADISSRFGYLPVDELPGAIEDTLHRIVETLDVDRSTFFELSDTGGTIEAMHFWARPDIPPLRLSDAEGLRWYLGRLRRGEIVRVVEAERDLPLDADPERTYVRQAGMKSNLTVPVLIGGQLVGALAVGTFRHRREWPEPLVDRVRLLAQIIAAALQRRRQELALRASLAEVERLNRRLQAENIYLHKS